MPVGENPLTGITYIFLFWQNKVREGNWFQKWPGTLSTLSVKIYWPRWRPQNLVVKQFILMVFKVHKHSPRKLNSTKNLMSWEIEERTENFGSLIWYADFDCFLINFLNIQLIFSGLCSYIYCSHFEYNKHKLFGKNVLGPPLAG